MAKKKGSKAENSCDVKKVGDDFVCVECNAKIPEKEEYCPGCKRLVNWDRAYFGLKRFI